VHDTPDLGRIRDRVRELSKCLLGAQFRAEVAALIEVGEAPFWARSMSMQLGIPENKISAELSRFADENLLMAVPSQAWDRRKLFERSSKPRTIHYWRAGLEIVELAALEEAERVGSDPRAVLGSFFAGAEMRPTRDQSETSR
jgi:hypothetical protein